MPGFHTLSLHAGRQSDPAAGSCAVPIHQTVAFAFGDAGQAERVLDLQCPAHALSHLSNPTVAVLEERVAALEGGIGAVCAASGQAALMLAVTTLMGQGGHMVATVSPQGMAGSPLAHTLPRFGVATTFADPRDPEAVRAAIGPHTRLVIGETIGDPGLEVLDIPAVAAIAHGAGVPLLIDNSAATPYLCRPLSLGADLVVHSLSGLMGGHGVAVGGCVVDGGGFDWRRDGRYPTLTEACAAWPGLVFDEQFGPAAFLMRARFEGLGHFGACLSPTHAFHLLQGLETLALRMGRHVDNARAVAGFLAGHDAVAWVSHPDRADHPDHALAARLLPRGGGAAVAFGIRGGAIAARRFLDALRLVSLSAAAGDGKTQALWSARMGDVVRLSVGLEDAADVAADLAQAFKQSQKG